MNPFELLELSPGASADDIKAAYHRLAKQWHPDRFEGAEKAQAETRFREISEAFAILKDPFKREQFEQKAQKAMSATQPVVVEPPKAPMIGRPGNDWFGEAKKGMDGGDPERALGLIQYAIRLEGQRAEFYQFYGQLLEKRGLDRRSVVKAYETSHQLNPKNVEVVFRLADNYQALGMHARAERMLQIARELAPRHKYFKQAAAAADAGKGNPAQSAGGLMDQIKSVWNRLARKG